MLKHHPMKGVPSSIGMAVIVGKKNSGKNTLQNSSAYLIIGPVKTVGPVLSCLMGSERSNNKFSFSGVTLVKNHFVVGKVFVSTS